MRARDISDAIEAFAPLSFQESWDNSGFSVGDPQKEVHSAMLGLDCTPQLVDEAISEGCDMIITHHPLIFSGIKKITSENNIGKMLQKIIKHDIVVYSAHTSIDKVLEGVSGRMAHRLGLVNNHLLEGTIQEGGLGVVGELSSPMKSEAFIRKVKEVFSLKCIRCSKPISGEIKKVALCGGSGKSLIDSALLSGAQVYISGDIPYHAFLTEREDFMIMDIGHFESEIDIVQTIFSILKENFPTFAVQFVKNNNNLVYYF